MPSASRFLRFGSSLFLRIISNTRSHKILSPILYLKPMPSLQFHLDSSSSTAATKDGDGIAETSNSLQKPQNHPWPQWVNFVDKLKTRGYFMEIPTNSTSDDNVCSSCNPQSSCDRAHVILKGKEAEGCTVDIVWILMSYALNPLVISGGEKSPGRELIEASARKLLSELIGLSQTPLDPAVSKHTPKAAHEERDVDFMGGILCEHVEMKKGDWICPKCNIMNFSKNKRC